MKSQTDRYSNSGLKITIGEAQIVAMSPEGMQWEGAYNDFGNWNFPSIYHEHAGRIAVSFNTHHDSALNYGLPGKVYFSDDNGNSWQCPGRMKNAVQDIALLHAKPIDLSGGEQIAIFTTVHFLFC